MPKRKIIFANNEYYHIYNRSTGGISIFQGNKTLNRSLGLLDFYRFPQKIRYSKYLVLPKEEKLDYEKSFRSQKPLVEIYSFCFMSNHFHILLRQIEDVGIKKYISNFQNSFAKYYNTKNDRHGGVYQGPFKAKYIDKENYLLHLSRYIHLNPVTSHIINIEELDNYPWTSLPYYLSSNLDKYSLINTDLITTMVGSKDKYKKFVHDQADYQRQLKKIKGLLME